MRLGAEDGDVVGLSGASRAVPRPTLMPAMPLPTTTSLRGPRATTAQRRASSPRSRPSATRAGSGAHGLSGVFEAAAGRQAEVLLVDGRGDDQLALQVADDAARQHVGAAVRIVVVEREDLRRRRGRSRSAGRRPAQRRPLSRQEVVERADVLPAAPARFMRPSSRRLRVRSSRVAGRIWPRSSTNTTLSSARSLLTKWRKRLSVSGSSIAFFHSHS